MTIQPDYFREIDIMQWFLLNERNTIIYTSFQTHFVTLKTALLTNFMEQNYC